MTKQHPIEIFMPPNMLKAKVGGGVAGLDMAAIRRAEAAVETLKADFTEWVGDDVARLCDCRDRFAKTRDSHARDALFLACHDIKGQAASFDFPLVARVAASLCKLLDVVKAPDAVPLNLVDAHVTAIRIIFRDRIKDAANRMAGELAEELEARVFEASELAV